MARLGARFNAEEHDTDKQGGGFVKPPEGIYRLEVSESSIVENGQNIKASMKISITQPEQYKGSLVFFDPWIQNSNPDWQAWGQADLAKICRACGVNDIEDTDELHFIEFTGELKNGKPYQKKRDGVPQVDENGAPIMVSNLKITKFFYPDQGEPPELKIYGTPANDNTPAARPAARATPANDNAPAQQPAAAAGGRARPWAKK